MHQQKGLDVNKRLGWKSSFPDEREVLVVDHVDPRLIIGAYRVDKDGIVPGTFYGNPTFESSSDASARHAVLVDASTRLATRHAQLSAEVETASKGNGGLFRKKNKQADALKKELAVIEGQLAGIMR